VSEPAQPERNPKMNRFDPLGTDQALACLQMASQILHNRAANERGSKKRKLKNMETAVDGAIGSISRQGLTVDEYQAAVATMRSEAYGASRPRPPMWY
jgi:hypothetical protein